MKTINFATLVPVAEPQAILSAYGRAKALLDDAESAARSNPCAEMDETLSAAVDSVLAHRVALRQALEARGVEPSAADREWTRVDDALLHMREDEAAPVGRA